jgi:hypothetical protein
VSRGAVFAIYPFLPNDSTGSPLNGANNNTYRFPHGQLPPVNAFWSLTLYKLPESLLVANPINRYLINSPMLPSLKADSDGGYTFASGTNRPVRPRNPTGYPRRKARPATPAVVMAERRSARWPMEGAAAAQGLGCGSASGLSPRFVLTWQSDADAAHHQLTRSPQRFDRRSSTC